MKKLVIILLIGTLLASFGCTKIGTPKDVQGKDFLGEYTEIDLIEEQIKGMTLEEKIGQLVIVGLEGYIIDDYTKNFIDNYHVGGFILFGHNVESPKQLLALTNSLKGANSKNETPLFISVDEEGGRVSRMPDGIRNLPTNKVIGKMNNSNLSYEIGSVLAEEIKAFGFNMNFAPVLDINSNPLNPVIGDRSFGSDVKVVSKLGIQTMKGIREGGIIPVVKHFPGHGDTSVDSHVGLPSITHEMDRLNNFEFIPFKEAINNQADAVMVAHIILNKIDSKNPASLSKTIVTDLLRKDLLFNGVVITDDLTMGAIVKNYSIGDAAVKAINAGSDIVLVCHGQDNGVVVLNSIKQAIENGTISKDTLDKSVYRILKLKHNYHLKDNIIETVHTDEVNSKIDHLDIPR